MVRVTISGKIIDRRDQVLMGFLELAATAASILQKDVYLQTGLS